KNEQSNRIAACTRCKFDRPLGDHHTMNDERCDPVLIAENHRSSLRRLPRFARCRENERMQLPRRIEIRGAEHAFLAAKTFSRAHQPRRGIVGKTNPRVWARKNQAVSGIGDYAAQKLCEAEIFASP